MTLIKSLAACGLILTTATPVTAFDFTNWKGTYDRFRTQLGDEPIAANPIRTIDGAVAPATLTRTSFLANNMPAVVAPKVRAPVVAAPTISPPVWVPPAATKAPEVPSIVAQPTALSSRTVGASTPASAVARPSSTNSRMVQAPRAPSGTVLFAGDDPSFASMMAAVNAAIASFSGRLVETVSAAAAVVAESVSGVAENVLNLVSDVIEATVETVTATVGKLDLSSEFSSHPAAVVSLVQAPVDATSRTNTASGTPPRSQLPVPAPAPDTAPAPAPVPDVQVSPAKTPHADYEARVGSGTVYYVDFANGNDANSGTSASKPWKRVPGDSEATGIPASAVLKGGDTVRFKGGVSYRGALRLKFSGTAEEPIVFTGTGYGVGSAIFDGADAVTSSVPCPSQSACGGASNWSSLRLVKYTEPTGTGYRKLFDEAGALFEAKAPVASDPFWGDNISEMAVLPVAQASALRTGRLENAELAAAATGQQNTRLLLWESGNVVNEYKILSISGSTILFDATGLTPYTDRDSRGAIIGSLKAITKPGLYAILSPGTAIVYPRNNGGTEFFIGSGRFAFNMNGQSNIVIGGFEFLRGTADSKEWYRGVAIANHASNVVKNLVVERNRFAHAALKTGRGIIHLGTSDGVTIRDNSLSDIEFGSGMRLFGRNFTVERNRLQRIGRTGIYMGGMINGTVRSNILADLRGVHGNAMSFYLANTNIQVTNNCVFGSTRPLTWHGNKSVPMVNNLQFIGNILISTPTGAHASASWGAFTGGVTYRNNLAIGGKYGVLLNAKDTNVTVTQNRMRAIVFNGGQPAAWTVTNNQIDATYAEVANATLTMNGCRARGHSGDLVVTL